MGGQAVQRLHHGLVGEGQGLVHPLALDELGGHGAGGDGTAAAKGLELHVHDDSVLDFEVHFHDIAALGVTHLSYAVGIGDLAYVAGITKMIHHLFTV